MLVSGNRATLSLGTFAGPGEVSREVLSARQIFSVMSATCPPSLAWGTVTTDPPMEAPLISTFLCGSDREEGPVLPLGQAVHCTGAVQGVLAEVSIPKMKGMDRDRTHRAEKTRKKRGQ